MLAASILAPLGSLAGVSAWSGEWDVGRWQEKTALTLMLIAGPGTLALLAAQARMREHDRELATGAVVLSVVVFVVLAVAFILWTEWPSTEWVRFAVVAIIALAGMYAAAAEWTRRSLLLLGLLLAVLLTAVVASIGIDAVRQKLRDDHEAQIERAEESLNRLESLAEQRKTARTVARDNAVAGLAAVLSCRGDVSTEALLAVANRLRAALDAGAGPPDEVRRAVAALRPCAIPVAEQLPLVAERAAAAIDSDAETRKAQPDRAPVTRAINEARAHKGDTLPAKKARTALQIEAARYRAAVTGEKRDQDALEALLKAEPTEDPVAEETTLLTALAEGAEAIARSATDENAARFVPGPLGWVLLGAVALSVWGALLRRNALQLAGPVKVEGKGGEDVDLRIAVLQNLAEPGAAPGASTASPITNLLDVAGPGLGTVKKIVEAVLAVIGRRYGYTVYADIAKTGADGKAVPGADRKDTTPAADGKAAPGAARKEATPAADRKEATPGADRKEATPGADGKAATPAQTRVLVRVKDLQSEATLGVRLVEDDDALVAVRAAGLWAAGFILERSSRIPTWAAWDADSAKALATSRADNPTLEDAKDASRSAPNSGLLLILLGARYELHSQQRDAVAVYARAVAGHPTYLTARYRLAVSLGMLSNDPSKQWTAASPDARAPVLAALRQAVQRVGLHGTLADELQRLAAADEKGHRVALQEMAKVLLLHLEVEARFLPIASASLRRSERDMLRPLLDRKGRARFHDLVWSASGIYTDRVGDVIAKADGPGSWWQVSYNAACAKARSGDALEAMRLLEQCLARPGVHQLKADWVRVDPDLKSLQGWPRFDRFSAQLEGSS